MRPSKLASIILLLIILANSKIFDSRKSIFRILKPKTFDSKLVEAVSKYREIVGDLKIPKDFIVPADNSWPTKLWNYNLGSIAKNTRYKRKSKIFKNTTLEALEHIGFISDTRSSDFDTVCAALECYKRVYGNLLVPQHFVVPKDETGGFPRSMWGLKLGLRVKAIRQADQYYNLNQSAILDRLGFPWNYVDAQREVLWARDYAALALFKEKFGHLNIPQDFVVPSNDNSWPDQARGIRLGSVLRRIISGVLYTEFDRQQILAKLGVVVKQSSISREKNFRYVYEALCIYKKIYGDLLVPRQFTVPSQEGTWPKHLWQLPLGVRVGSIRQGKSHYSIESTAMLDRIGFVWDLGDYKFDLFIAALKTYKSLYGNLYVPQMYKVANGDADWPKELWGYKLGNYVQRTRQDVGKVSDEKKVQLAKVGFIWNARQSIYDFNTTLCALMLYKKSFGSTDVPVSWSVPLDDIWPADLWSMPLGQIVQNFRHRKATLDSTQESQLKSMGFVFREERNEKYFRETVSALKVFKGINGHCDVIAEFKVPKERSWPDALHGMCLGSRVRAIRQNKRQLLDKLTLKELEDLGFVFNPRLKQSEELLNAAIVYAERMNSSKMSPLVVPDKFIIPVDESWPVEIHGFRLGPRLKYLRESITKKSKGTGMSSQSSSSESTLIKSLEKLGFILTSEPEQ